MDRKPKVMMIGLDPSVVVYDRWPGMTPEKLEAALRRDEAALLGMGYDARICFVDHGKTAAVTVTEALSEGGYDCILIGAGVRTDPEEFTLFEMLINIVHEQAPGAKICFNSGPVDSVAAVQRWV